MVEGTNAMNMTAEEIRTRGLRVLRKELGQTGMVRFLQQFSLGHGDYARERRVLADRLSEKEVLAGIARAEKRLRPRKTRK
jgi:hypothetical protein